jgi:hypothetical protein
MEELSKLTAYAGPIALAAFAGVFLGGIALSFFWKNFGPWKMLESCREECSKCHSERATLGAEVADLKARHETMQEAMELAGLGLIIGSTSKRD